MMHKRKIYSTTLIAAMLLSCNIAVSAQVILPMLATKYSQTAPYNNDCPNNSATGCGWVNTCSIYKFRLYDTSEWYREKTRNQLLRIILMSQTLDDNKRISKNTLLLYSHRHFPMFCLCFYNFYRELTYSY